MQSINSNPLYRLFIPKPLRTYIWKKYLKSKIINTYKDTKNSEIKEIIKNIRKNGLQIIPSNLQKKYDEKEIQVYYDESKKLKYSNFMVDKKIYFKKEWSTKRIQKTLNQLLIEQDINSPHKYLTKKFNVDHNTIVADIGCAEANFSLEIVDKVKHIYLFETNKQWNKPLKATFEKYKKKVTIINKKFSNHNSNSHIDGSNFLKNKAINFLKIDVDGYEKEVMNSLNETIKKARRMKIALCTYHSNNDYKKYSELLKSLNYKVTSSKGYMIFYWDKKLSYPYLRKGVLRAEK